MKKEIKSEKTKIITCVFGIITAIFGIVININRIDTFSKIGSVGIFLLFGITCVWFIIDARRDIKKLQREEMLNDFDFIRDAK